MPTVDTIRRARSTRALSSEGVRLALRLFLLLALLCGAAHAGEVFLCPMHAEVRRDAPGRCPRCGMALSAAPSHRYDAYPLLVVVEPRTIPARTPLQLRFTPLDPHTGAAVQNLRIVHERPFHLFVVSEDLNWFEHVHPEPRPDGTLALALTLPRDGRYQLLADFFPEGGAPQLVQRAIVTAGWRRPLAAARLNSPSAAEQHVGDLRMRLSQLRLPAGRPVELELEVHDAAGAAAELEPLLGAPLHALAVSADLVDAVHTHGELAGPGRIRFQLRLPRPGGHRLWLQVQRRGEVITVPFTVIASPPAAL